MRAFFVKFAVVVAVLGFVGSSFGLESIGLGWRVSLLAGVPLSGVARLGRGFSFAA